MNTRQLADKYLLNTYAQLDFVPDYGIGSRLYNQYNNDIIDFAGGIAVNALGHSHPQLVKTLNNQAQKLWHISNIMVSTPQVELSQNLIENSCFDQVFFCNSGTEAIEASLKLARRYCRFTHSPNKHNIVSFKNSFHGRSLFAVSVGGQDKYSEDYQPLPPGIRHGVFNDCSNLERLINADVAAVIIEPIQAEGGVIPATHEFLTKIRQLCDQHNALLIFDEVQTGIGRTGKLFAYMNYDIEPDVIAIAKALGCGFPIGAILVKEKFTSGFNHGTHGSTFGGNPLASAIANEAFNIINDATLLAHVIEKIYYLLTT